MSKIWPYIASFLLGGLIVSLYALNKLKPTIIADNYIESLEQSVKKLKQSGTNNNQDIKSSIELLNQDEPKERKKFLGIFKRKNKKV